MGFTAILRYEQDSADQNDLNCSCPSFVYKIQGLNLNEPVNSEGNEIALRTDLFVFLKKDLRYEI